MVGGVGGGRGRRGGGIAKDEEFDEGADKKHHGELTEEEALGEGKSVNGAA